jgi:8-oxo-dGTP diphosphatase
VPAADPQQVQVVQALVRRGTSLLLVLQGEPGAEPHWSTPGGVVKPGELVSEALARELHEETGLTFRDPAEPAFVAQLDNRSDGYFATVWTFEVVPVEGEPAVADPDQLVHRALFWPLEEALDLLRLVEWQGVTVEYLTGALSRGSLVLERRHVDGRLERVATF